MTTTEDFSELERKLRDAVEREHAARAATKWLIGEARIAGMPLTRIAPALGETIMTVRGRIEPRPQSVVALAEKSRTAAKLKYEALYDAQPILEHPANSLIKQIQAAEMISKERADINNWIAGGRIAVEDVDGVPMVKLDGTGRFRIAPPRTKIDD